MISPGGQRSLKFGLLGLICWLLALGATFNAEKEFLEQEEAFWWNLSGKEYTICRQALGDLRGLNVDPDKVRLLEAVLAVSEQDLSRAVPLLEELSADDSREHLIRGWAWYNLGCYYESQDRINRAQRCYGLAKADLDIDRDIWLDASTRLLRLQTRRDLLSLKVRSPRFTLYYHPIYTSRDWAERLVSEMEGAAVMMEAEFSVDILTVDRRTLSRIGPNRETIEQRELGRITLPRDLNRIQVYLYPRERMLSEYFPEGRERCLPQIGEIHLVDDELARANPYSVVAEWFFARVLGRGAPVGAGMPPRLFTESFYLMFEERAGSGILSDDYTAVMLDEGRLPSIVQLNGEQELNSYERRFTDRIGASFYGELRARFGVNALRTFILTGDYRRAFRYPLIALERSWLEGLFEREVPEEIASRIRPDFEELPEVVLDDAYVEGLLLLRLAREQLALGNAGRAERLLWEALDLLPTYPEARRELIELFQRGGNLEEIPDLIDEYLALVQDNPDDLAWGRMMRASVYEQELELDQAALQIAEALLLEGLSEKTMQELYRMEDRVLLVRQFLPADDAVLTPDKLDSVAKVLDRLYNAINQLDEEGMNFWLVEDPAMPIGIGDPQLESELGAEPDVLRMEQGATQRDELRRKYTRRVNQAEQLRVRDRLYGEIRDLVASSSEWSFSWEILRGESMQGGELLLLVNEKLEMTDHWGERLTRERQRVFGVVPYGASSWRIFARF